MKSAQMIETNRLSLKSTCTLLFIIFLISLFPVGSFAALPDISKAIETRLHLGTNEQILSFIQERQNHVLQLTNEAETIVEQSKNQSEEEALTNAIDYFQDISVQLQRLRSELKKSADLSIKAPVLGQAPYSPAIFSNIRSFQKEVDQLLGESANKVDQLNNKLAMLNKNLESQLFEYSRLKHNEPSKALAYEKAAYIFSLQAKYSLLILQQTRLTNQLNSLHTLQKEGAGLIKKCLKNIHIADEDIAIFKKRLETAVLEQEGFHEEIRTETNSLDNKLLSYELQLENFDEKLSNTLENDNKNNFLKIEKKRIVSIIDTIEVKRRSLEQQNINKKINTISATFSFYMINNYARHEYEKEVGDDINFWMEKQEYLKNTYNALNDELLQVGEQTSQSHQKLLIVNDELRSSQQQPIKEALGAFERQLLKENELIDSLKATLLDSQNDIRIVLGEIGWLIDLLQKEIPLHENIQAYFEKNLRMSWETVRSVLYYPFFSLGETDITLVSILKFIFLLTVGLFFLQGFRKKAAMLLQQKTNLSRGSVTSITTLGYYFAVVLGVFIVLSTVGVNLSQLTVIFGALGVGIGFGLQTIANNFISGIILLTEQVIKSGDIINLENGVTGEVKKVAIRSTIIRTVNGDDVIVPNSELVSNKVNTWTYGDDWRRLTIPFGVSYASDPDEIVRLALEAAREVEITREDVSHPVCIFFEGYGDNSLDFSIKVWCRMFQLRALSGLRSDYYFSLFKKLKKAGIEIPFPQRDLHLQSISPKVEESLKRLAEQRNNEIS
jgi:small-conductance mechanosensitive channel